MATQRTRKSIHLKGNRSNINALSQSVTKTAKKIGKKGGASTVMSGAAGAVIGATVGGIAGAALADEKTRKNVGEKLGDLTKIAAENMQRMSERADDLAQEAKHSANKVAATTHNMREKITKNN